MEMTRGLPFQLCTTVSVACAGRVTSLENRNIIKVKGSNRMERMKVRMSTRKSGVWALNIFSKDVCVYAQTLTMS